MTKEQLDRLLPSDEELFAATDAMLAKMDADYYASQSLVASKQSIKSGFTSNMTILESMVEGVRQGMTMDIWEQLQGYKYSMYNVKYGERRKYWRQAMRLVNKENS